MKVTSDVGPWSIVPEWVVDSDVSDRAIRLYTILGRYADRDGKSFPSRRTLSERLRCSVDSIDRAVRELTSVGALEIKERYDDEGQTSNLYLLKMAAPVRHPLGKPAAPPVRNGAAQNESHSELETSLAAAPPVSRKHPMWDPLWNTLTEGFGPATTKDAQSRRAKAVKTLIEVDATPDEVLSRGKRWRRHFPGATLTQEALVKWWDTLPRKELR